MPGRHQPKPTESEKTREYRTFQRRSHGDAVAGDLAADVGTRGPVEEIESERRAWAAEREREEGQNR